MECVIILLIVIIALLLIALFLLLLILGANCKMLSENYKRIKTDSYERNDND